MKNNNTFLKLLTVPACMLFVVFTSNVNACGYWLAWDVQHNWLVRFGCGSDNAMFEASEMLTGGRESQNLHWKDVLDKSIWRQSVFRFNWDEISKRRKIKDGVIYFDNEKVGTISGDSFSIRGEQFKMLPCTDDNTPCKDKPKRMEIVKEGNPVLVVMKCPYYCNLQNVVQPLTYILFKQHFLAEGDTLYRSANERENLHRIRTGLKNNDYRAAASAIELGSKAVPVFEEILKQKKVRWEEIARTLFAISKSRVTSASLIKLVEHKALNGKFWRVRKSAVITLGSLQNRGSIPIIQKAMTDNKGDVRRAAVWAIGEVGYIDEYSTKLLLKTLTDSDYTVRTATATTLGNTHTLTEDVIHSLKWRVQNDRTEVANAAQKALDQLKTGTQSTQPTAASTGLNP